MLRRSFMGILALLGARPASAADTDSAALWRRLREGGYVVLMRHAATVPGVGDPENFKLGACATQRNLSDRGREDARRVGAAFREREVPVSEVLSSRWCRCVDTAQLAFGRVRPEAMVDSMFNDDDAARQNKVRALRAYLSAHKAPGNLVLVTHDINIRVLVGESLAQGEMVVALAQPDGTLKSAGVLPLPK
ncbi:Phosphohistidine phosphatase SixA [Duganella sp. CF517]|uniref:histidine phosphatase family protein n=1 Tax=Duganella sp. CF517 TaxID=1881038 RepID=UPI0008C8279E|nr:histidine phosphatase family protein [Duganella sp. CF517]SEO53323.1 Phosphohistidine phosphatase SixA [Duganella sp. CF517]